MAVIDTLTVNLAAQTAGLTKGLKSAESQVKGFANSIKGPLAAVSAAFAGAFTIGAAKNFVQSGLEFADEIADTAARLQITAESLNRLRHAAEMSDVPMDTLVMGMERLAKTLGVAPDVALLKFADQISQMPDKFERAKAATEIFGKSGVRLIPLLNEGSAGLNKLGDEVAGMFSPENTKKLNDVDQAWKAITESFKKLRHEVVVELAPGLTQIGIELKGILDTYKVLVGLPTGKEVPHIGPPVPVGAGEAASGALAKGLLAAGAGLAGSDEAGRLSDAAMKDLETAVKEGAKAGAREAGTGMISALGLLFDRIFPSQPAEL
jgi:hypothetical protein